jgi:hypothetical protein
VTDPPGASVREDGVEVCGSAPCDLLYEGDAADPAREHKITVSLAGYRPQTKSVKLGDSPIQVKLARLPVVRGGAPAAPPRAEGPAAPPGYKNDVPY